MGLVYVCDASLQLVVNMGLVYVCDAPLQLVVKMGLVWLVNEMGMDKGIT